MKESRPGTPDLEYERKALQAGYWWLIAEGARHLAMDLDDVGRGGSPSQSSSEAQLSSLSSLVDLTRRVDESKAQLGREFGVHDYSDEMGEALHRIECASPIAGDELRHLGRYGVHWTLATRYQMNTHDRAIIENWRHWLDPGGELAVSVETPEVGVPLLPEEPRYLRQASIDLFRWTVQDVWPAMEEPVDWPPVQQTRP